MYALIVDNKIVFGPRAWKYSMFVRYFVNNDLDYSDFPKYAPKEPVVTDTYKLLPVNTIYPTYDPVFEQLSGPYKTIFDDRVESEYLVNPNSVSGARSKLKQQVTEDRYKLETGGVNFTFADGTEVELYTNREDRNTYLDALLTIPDGATVTFKFKGEKFVTVDKTDLQNIVNTVVSHVQSAFEWEATKHAELDAAEDTLDALKLIDTIHPDLVETPEEPV